jgi:6-phosphofructokinase 1
MLSQSDLIVPSFGACRYTTPLDFDSPSHPGDAHFLEDNQRIRLSVRVGPQSDPASSDLTLEEAGPRKRIFFDPPRTAAAMVTCGGLSPGLNNVIRSIFEELQENYGVPRVLGIRNGYLGLNPASGLDPIEIKAEFVESIHKLGGTVLGTSRGPQDPSDMIDFLQSHGINMLFCIGGDGTQRGANALHEEIARRQLPISIIGIPKTIDNDISFVEQSFGYATALEKAAEIIRSAHVEARGAINGIGLVKLMGRHSGAIAAGASVVSQEVDFTLVPEIPFPLEGEGGFLDQLEQRIVRRAHAVIVVAEGAGQHLFPQSEHRRDASGNQLLHDIGLLLKERIVSHFQSRNLPAAMKYFDPSYFIRSVPANVSDRVLCNQMGRLAVHAAMAGKTGMMIGMVHRNFVNVPIPVVIRKNKTLDLRGALWRAVLESTRQPRW